MYVLEKPVFNFDFSSIRLYSDEVHIKGYFNHLKIAPGRVVLKLGHLEK